MPVGVKRDLVLKSLDWHFRKGTPSVVEDIVSTVFSKAIVQEWFEYDGLPYRFRIGIDGELLDETARKSLIRAINNVKNTRSYLDAFTPMMFFEDEFNVTDYIMMIVNVNGFEDIYKKRLQFNGAIKFDGHTVNNRITGRGKFNSRFRFNGDLNFNGIGILPVPYQPARPFKFSSGIVDSLVYEPKSNTNDHAQMNEAVFAGIRNHHKFNGAYKFDGSIKFNSMKFTPLW
jgi:hypothetical protein